jgi:SAM-dependent methyltransferase
MNDKIDEILRIQCVYSGRDSQGRRSLYAWHRPEVRQQEADKERIASAFLSETVGDNLANIQVLDVGCGTGTFLRMLVEWGATPENLLGTDFLPDRLEVARRISAPGIQWHLVGLDFAASDSFDLVVTNTVFSSILDEQARHALAQEMWRVLKPGGWVMVFDFRYNNPSNSDVRRVTRRELNRYWPSSVIEKYQTLLLVPPIARRLVPISRLAGEVLATIPLLRSHFYFMAQKPL